VSNCSFRALGAPAAAALLRDKRVVVAGDSVGREVRRMHVCLDEWISSSMRCMDVVFTALPPDLDVDNLL
jgi:hypothetical protein